MATLKNKIIITLWNNIFLSCINNTSSKVSKIESLILEIINIFFIDINYVFLWHNILITLSNKIMNFPVLSPKMCYFYNISYFHTFHRPTPILIQNKKYFAKLLFEISIWVTFVVSFFFLFVVNSVLIKNTTIEI